jgi:UDP-N-acetylglucosamine 2-epimerase (non-hydrolysing)/GDP/UDP-N,N'-diacetylbacillosamine 2-epimerase (hydrolysing)
MPRRIAAITSSRADYMHLYWVLRELSARPEVELSTIAMGPHLSPEFGTTVEQIERDGFKPRRVECLLSSDTDIGMAKTIGVATLSLADLLGEIRPDLLLLIADRYEMLAPASVALALRIPIAHIEGGEISEGAIDDAVRNALTKLSHIHFTSTAGARERVIALGEDPARVHQFGAPSLDHLRRATLPGRDEVERKINTRLASPVVVVGYHPVTVLRDTVEEADALFRALEQIDGQLLFCYPNADAGSRLLLERTQGFVGRRQSAKLFVNFDPLTYWGLLRLADLFVGNSSSGIIETASFALPTVNVGIRQRGREHGANVLDAGARSEAILAQIERALDPGFRASLQGMVNPYGDGQAAEKIARVLAETSLDEEFIVKRTVPVSLARISSAAIKR